MIWLAIKTIVGSCQSVVKLSHDYEDLSASWPTGHEWRVIKEWSAVGYLQRTVS
jgi:hypothetical protein